MVMVVMVVVTVVGTDFVSACNISFGRRSGVGSLFYFMLFFFLQFVSPATSPNESPNKSPIESPSEL